VPNSLFSGSADLAWPRYETNQGENLIDSRFDPWHIRRVLFKCLNLRDFFFSALEEGCPSEMYYRASPTPALLRRGPTSAVLGQLLDSFKLCIDEFLKFGVPPP